MTTTTGVTATSAPSALDADFGAGMTTLSPEALLDYCQMQLGSIDDQIKTQMTAQQTALRERSAVESAQSVLDQFGTAGPQSAGDMAKCVDALNQAIAQLPADDPVASQLAAFRDKMTSDYQYTAQPLTDAQQQELAQAQAAVAAGKGDQVLNPNAVGVGTTAQALVDNLTSLQAGQLGAKPDADTKQWQGTTDSLSAIGDDIKSSAELQMLQLQDLVSQRQQAVQIASGMMGKVDQTLEDQAKAIGQ